MKFFRKLYVWSMNLKLFLSLYFMALIGLTAALEALTGGSALPLWMLVEALGLVLGADKTLGGLCDWIEPEAPASVDLPVAGGIAYKAAVIPVALHYTTTGPLA